MTTNSDHHDVLEEIDSVYLGKLRLAIDILLRVGKDPGALPNVLESELFLYRDRCERALLLAGESSPIP